MVRTTIAIIIVIATSMFLLHEPARAAQLNMLLGSYHSPGDDDYCEFNPGLQVLSDNGIGAMIYKNSNCDVGATLTKTYRINKYFTLSGGAAFGYDWEPIVPFATLNAHLGPVFIGFIPGRTLADLINADAPDAQDILFFGVTILEF